jgi:hypothetical protein
MIIGILYYHRINLYWILYVAFQNGRIRATFKTIDKIDHDEKWACFEIFRKAQEFFVAWFFDVNRKKPHAFFDDKMRNRIKTYKN